MGFTEKIVADVQEGKHPAERKSHVSKLEAYKEKPVFITVDNMEDVIESVVRKLLGSSGTGGMNSEALRVWLLKFGDHSKKHRISVESFVLIQQASSSAIIKCTPASDNNYMHTQLRINTNRNYDLLSVLVGLVPPGS